MCPVRRRVVLALVILSLVGPNAARVNAAEPSPRFRDELRRTVEKRKERRRAQASQPVGTIVPYPFPPALVIRHTREVHDEIGSLLDALRR
jgi:hypothetical protein